MITVNLIKDKEGKLHFSSSNGGKLVDISKEFRAKIIDLEKLTKKLIPVFKNFYIIRHKLIIPMARIEDSKIDAIYLARKKKHAIILPSICDIKWNGKSI